MASYGNPLRDHMLSTRHRRPSNMMLKDYLRDDLSSCSSSGFKSLPRRQCCTAVRFDLLEKDLQAKRNRLLLPSISNRSSCSFKVASSTVSALHKASRAVINAVKLIPFSSIYPTPSSSHRNNMKRLLSKSLSRKVLSRSFCRKAIKEEETESRRWRSFRELLEEKEKPSDQNTQSSSTVSVTLGSSSSGSSRQSNGNSWESREFTWEILRSSSIDNSDVVVLSGEKTLHKTVTTKTSEDSTDGCTLEKVMDWAREEKEQLSPVSVLDCPFGDDEEINSPLDSTCSGVEGETVPGRKNKRMQKTRHFDHMPSSLKPVDLEKRMAEFSKVEDDGPISTANEKSKGEEQAWRLVKEVESSTLCMSKAEMKLLFDFFNEENVEKEGEVSKVAKEWIRGESQGANNMGREIYVREMDKCERWTNISDEEVGMEVEFEVLTSLVNDLVLELTS